jgi:hypothetical protein
MGVMPLKPSQYVKLVDVVRRATQDGTLLDTLKLDEVVADLLDTFNVSRKAAPAMVRTLLSSFRD